MTRTQLNDEENTVSFPRRVVVHDTNTVRNIKNNNADDTLATAVGLIDCFVFVIININIIPLACDVEVDKKR